MGVAWVIGVRKLAFVTYILARLTLTLRYRKLICIASYN